MVVYVATVVESPLLRLAAHQRHRPSRATMVASPRDDAAPASSNRPRDGINLGGQL
jgi:hypothetical protein